METLESINVRELLRESSDFGLEQIQLLLTAMAGSQMSEARQETESLRSDVEASGSSASADQLARIGIALYLLGNHADADRYLSEVSGNGVASFYHAQTLLTLRRFSEADDKFRKAGELGHDPVECTLLRVGAIRQDDRLDEAEQLLRSTVSEGATRAEYSYQMGCILSDCGDTYGAIEYFERAVDMAPHHSRALFALAGENSLRGNDNEAIRLYERSLSNPPHHLGALLNLGLLYEDNENYSAAAFCFQGILRSDPNHERARLYLKDIEATSEMYYDEDHVRDEARMEQLLSRPVTDFELTVRSRNCLENIGIETLGDLTQVTEQHLLSGKNFGETSLSEITELLAAHGLAIGQNIGVGMVRPTDYSVEDVSPEERLLLDRPISELNLSVRARKCMARLRLTTFGELVQRTPDELLGSKNFGVTSLNEIRSKLDEAGLRLRND